ncbi:MAG: DUF3536 domain-containing protein [Gemmatimonadales bacterium]
MNPNRSVVIHGHFYQPPRENPWLDEVEAEHSARPAHDWNERIEQECYRAVAAARIAGPEQRIARIVNLYESLSFNFGATLLEWMEQAAPATYHAVLEADRTSAARLGHGNAIAMPYHHAILPLSSHRDKVTEVRWGIADFERRFGRRPEGMWLPETAVDEETLDVLARAGIRFTVLAPSQVEGAPPGGHPGLVETSVGHSIAVFPYDGGIAHDVAFGPLVRDGAAFAARLLAAGDNGPGPTLVSVATDGETYGHHHHFGEMALAGCLALLEDQGGVTVENFASFLARHPATHPVKLVSPSAWSCSHGVERWRSNCGCRMSGEPSSQEWRTPLRVGLNRLVDACHAVYAAEAPAVLHDPVTALAGYGAVIGAGAEAVRHYGVSVARSEAGPAGVTRAIELLELERGALRTLTSCAWFFDDIGGLEPLQVLRYAAWAVQLAGAAGPTIEAELLALLAEAQSNLRSVGTGRDVYLHGARPVLPPMVRIGAGLAAARAWAPAAATSPAWALVGPDEQAELVNRRTGRSWPMTFTCDRLEFGVRVLVLPAGTPEPLSLKLGDLPERQRSAIAASFRTEALAQLLDREERAFLLSGGPFDSLLRRVLIREVAGLATDGSGHHRRAVLQVLMLLEGMGVTVPFDAQTTFYRIWQSRPELNELARKMGFWVE